MCSKGLLKRALPFFATLAIGLFIASFFVSLTPSFGERGFGRRCREAKRLRMENEQLRNEKLRLQNELENLRMSEVPMVQFHDHMGRGPEFPIEVAPPPPPMPPVAPRHTR
jgi:hypothetical protein